MEKMHESFLENIKQNLYKVKKMLQKMCIQSYLENLVSSHPCLKLRSRDCSHDKKV